MWKSLGRWPIGVLFLGSFTLGLYIVNSVLILKAAYCLLRPGLTKMLFYPREIGRIFLSRLW